MTGSLRHDPPRTITGTGFVVHVGPEIGHASLTMAIPLEASRPYWHPKSRQPRVNVLTEKEGRLSFSYRGNCASAEPKLDNAWKRGRIWIHAGIASNLSKRKTFRELPHLAVLYCITHLEVSRHVTHSLLPRQNWRALLDQALYSYRYHDDNSRRPTWAGSCESNQGHRLPYG